MVDVNVLKLVEPEQDTGVVRLGLTPGHVEVSVAVASTEHDHGVAHRSSTRPAQRQRLTSRQGTLARCLPGNAR